MDRIQSAYAPSGVKTLVAADAELLRTAARKGMPRRPLQTTGLPSPTCKITISALLSRHIATLLSYITPPRLEINQKKPYRNVLIKTAQSRIISGFYLGVAVPSIVPCGGEAPAHTGRKWRQGQSRRRDVAATKTRFPAPLPLRRRRGGRCSAGGRGRRRRPAPGRGCSRRSASTHFAQASPALMRTMQIC